YLFWKKLGGRDQYQNPDFKELASLEGAVFEETQRILQNEQEFPDADYREISLTVAALASQVSVFKNISLRMADGAEEENRTANIEMNIDMRTFSWESYGRE